MNLINDITHSGNLRVSGLLVGVFVKPQQYVSDLKGMLKLSKHHLLHKMLRLVSFADIRENGKDRPTE